MTQASPEVLTGERPRSVTEARARFPGHVPGEIGVWVLILGDMMMFAVFFGIIVVLRRQQPAVFVGGQHRLHPGYGGLNTGLLLTSSLGVALAVRRARAGLPAVRLLGLALGCGVGFVGVKVLEYSSLASGGLTPRTSDFFMYYFVFTGIHLLHLVIGLGVLLFLMARTRQVHVLSPHEVMVIESGASFWHMVDLLWIVLFPLLYLVR